VPGFISANLHVNFDRTQVVNYAQWKSSEATAAAREDPKVVALMREQLQIADSFSGQ
jgi:adenine deaminase